MSDKVVARIMGTAAVLAETANQLVAVDKDAAGRIWSCVGEMVGALVEEGWIGKEEAAQYFYDMSLVAIRALAKGPLN